MPKAKVKWVEFILKCHIKKENFASQVLARSHSADVCDVFLSWIEIAFGLIHTWKLISHHRLMDPITLVLAIRKHLNLGIKKRSGHYVAQLTRENSTRIITEDLRSYTKCSQNTRMKKLSELLKEEQIVISFCDFFKTRPQNLKKSIWYQIFICASLTHHNSPFITSGH